MGHSAEAVAANAGGFELGEGTTNDAVQMSLDELYEVTWTGGRLLIDEELVKLYLVAPTDEPEEVEHIKPSSLEDGLTMTVAQKLHENKAIRKQIAERPVPNDTLFIAAGKLGSERVSARVALVLSGLLPNPELIAS